MSAPLTRQVVGLVLLDRTITKTPSCTSTPLPHFNGFSRVIITNAREILSHVHEPEGVKASVILKLWSNHCSIRAVSALIAKPFLEGLLDAYNKGEDEADITSMFAQNIHFPAPEDNTPRTLTPPGIWEFISPWLRWEQDQSKSGGILRVRFAENTYCLDPKACDPESYDISKFPVDPRIIPIFVKGL